MTEPLRFSVDGMTCAACAARIEKVLSRQPGVRLATVNYATAECAVLAEAEPATLIESVAKIGYGLKPAAAPVLGRHQDEARGLQRQAIGAAVLTAPVFVLGMAMIDAGWSRWIQALFGSLVVLAFGYRFHSSAIRQLPFGANMDTLIALGSLSALGASWFAMATGGHLYFETAAVIITLILFGKTLETQAKGSASAALERLLALGAPTVRILRNDTEIEAPAEMLRVGEKFVVRPGERIAADGQVIEGASAVDESLLTGESVPQEKQPGAPVYGGSINQEGKLVVQASRVGAETTLARIAQAVREAQATKAPVQRLADRVASIFVPVVLLIATATFLGALAFDLGLEAALLRAIAVLVIACPCALGLATPTAILVGSGRGSQLGIFVKNAAVFEAAHAIDTVVFDKTGTLTEGKLKLEALVPNDPALLQRLAAVELGSEHPVAKAVVAAATLPLPIATDFKSVPGRGVVAQLDQVVWEVGRLDWLAPRFQFDSDLEAQKDRLESSGATVFAAAWDQKIRALVAVRDQPREGAAEAVRALVAQGLEVHLLTGDGERPARLVAEKLGIQNICAGVLPEGKAAYLAKLEASGKQVAFVGDGINDAPALARARLGLAIGAGSDVAAESGGAVLMSPEPALVSTALRLSRATFRVIRQNLFWAFLYNVAAIPLAALGHLDPMIAALAMAFSSVSVVSNSLRLKWFR